jgi:hypothetical protein
MNSIVEKGASKVALFLLALQSSFLCGLYGCALTPLRMAYTPFSTKQYSNFRLREALRWKARKGGSRWGRGGKKASL